MQVTARFHQGDILNDRISGRVEQCERQTRTVGRTDICAECACAGLYQGGDRLKHVFGWHEMSVYPYIKKYKKFIVLNKT